MLKLDGKLGSNTGASRMQKQGSEYIRTPVLVFEANHLAGLSLVLKRHSHRHISEALVAGGIKSTNCDRVDTACTGA